MRDSKMTMGDAFCGDDFEDELGRIIRAALQHYALPADFTESLMMRIAVRRPAFGLGHSCWHPARP